MHLICRRWSLLEVSCSSWVARPGSQIAVHSFAGHSATGCYVAGHSVAENMV